MIIICTMISQIRSISRAFLNYFEMLVLKMGFEKYQCLWILTGAQKKPTQNVQNLWVKFKKCIAGFMRDFRVHNVHFTF